jgi:hypothetical protein
MVVPQSESTFETALARARRKQLLAMLMGRRASRRLPHLEDSVAQPWGQTHEGTGLVLLRRVVGSVYPSPEYDRDFLPLSDSLRDRWRNLEQVFQYSSFPPIVVYRIGDSYFVLDGHHRIAIARRWRIDSLEADITRVWSLRPRISKQEAGSTDD